MSRQNFLTLRKKKKIPPLLHSIIIDTRVITLPIHYAVHSNSRLLTITTSPRPTYSFTSALSPEAGIRPRSAATDSRKLATERATSRHRRVNVEIRQGNENNG